MVRKCHVLMQRTDAFKELEDGLLQLGLVEDARWLNGTRTCCYTTSSEMLGELGAMVRRIYGSVPVEAVTSLNNYFTECESAVQLAWPDYNLGER